MLFRSLNKNDGEQRVSLTISGSFNTDFFLYIATEENITKPGFRMDPVKELTLKDNKDIILTLPARSICTLTNMHVTHDEPAKKR